MPGEGLGEMSVRLPVSSLTSIAENISTANTVSTFTITAQGCTTRRLPFGLRPIRCAKKYYNISPYAFCNDNPVTFIDPDGRKWKTLEDKEKATRIQEISMFHVRSLEKAIQKIKRKIEVANNDISLSEKARNRKIKRYKENLSELQYKKIF